MKKLITIFIFFFSIKAFAQIPDTAGTFFARASQTEWIEYAGSFPPWAANDSITGVTVSGKNYVRKDMRSKTFDAQSVGILANGSDMSALIQRRLSDSKIKKLVFSANNGGDVIINSAVTVPAGKTIEVDGVILKGSGSINFAANTLIADPGQQIFDTTLTLTNVRGANGYFYASWYGIQPGTSDCYKYLSMSQGACLPGQTVKFPDGSFQLNREFTATKSFEGSYRTVIKYNPSATATAISMWTLAADSISTRNIAFVGSSKAVTGVECASGYKSLLIEGCDFSGMDQNGSETGNVQGILVRSNNPNLVIRNNNFGTINAKNTGISRSIKCSGTSGTKNMKIYDNVFDATTNTGAGSNWDCDNIYIESYTDSIGAQIYNNHFKNVNKRGIKLSASGIVVRNNLFESERWKTGAKSYACVSAYADDIQILNNVVEGGIYEKTIEVGVNGSDVKNIKVNNNILNTNTGLSGAYGVRVHGLNNWGIEIKGNYIQNVAIAIYLYDNGTNYIVDGNTAFNCSDNSISTISGNPYPNNRHYNLSLTNNKIIKGAAAALALGKIDGGIAAGNSIDSTNTFILDYAPYVDSLLSFYITDNFQKVDYGTGKMANWGNYSQRLTLTNPATCPGLVYTAVDSSYKQWIWQGGAWVKMVYGAGGGGSADWSDITSKPTTLSGYGITDAASSSHTHTFSSLTSKPTTLSGYGITDATSNARSAISLTTTGTSGAATYNNSTGVLNIPQYAAGMTNPMTTSQDIIVGGSSGTPTRLAKGTNGQYLGIASGNLAYLTPMAVDTGSYIPTIDTSGSSIDSYTVNRAFWERKGDRIRVWGTLSINTLSNSVQQAWFTLSLPGSYPSTFTDNISLSGSGAATSTNDIRAIRVWPFYIGTPITTATITYTKPASTLVGYFINYSYDYLISND